MKINVDARSRILLLKEKIRKLEVRYLVEESLWKRDRIFYKIKKINTKIDELRTQQKESSIFEI